MGFMDKAKKLAEQAQSKLDEVQTQFNERQAAGGGEQGGAAVEYDQHGRPVTPPEDRLQPEPGPSRPQGDPADDFPKAPEPPKDKSPSIDTGPKPGMTSGDPLGGG